LRSDLGRSSILRNSGFHQIRGLNQYSAFYGSEPDEYVAQAIPVEPIVPIAPAVPEVPTTRAPFFPWVNRSDFKEFIDLFQRNKSPLSGKDFQTEAERNAVYGLTPEQVKGLKKSPFKADLPFAVDSHKENACSLSTSQNLATTNLMQC
jgi:hypothetical protein